MNNLPVDTERQRTGRQAVAKLEVFLNELDVIVRREGQETDFGSDLELELHTDRFVSASIVKCQVKGTTVPAFIDRHTKEVSIKASTQNYWAALPVNVICILCDLSDGALYWKPASATLVNTEHTSVRFRDSMRIDQDPGEFMRALTRLAETPTSSQILALVPACLDIFAELSSHAHRHYDRGSEVEPEIDGSVRVFYDHLERLCIFTGVDDLPVPWSSWERRNTIVQEINDSSGSGLLDGELTVEIVRYAARFYEDALTRVMECVDTEQLMESNPRLASLLLSGAFHKAAIHAAFERFRDRQHFLVEVNSHYSFGLERTKKDLEFDEHLQDLGIESYRLSYVDIGWS